MIRIFSREWEGGDCLPPLEREEVHHLVRVRRVRIGEPVEVLNGRGSVAHCEVTGFVGKSVQLDIRNIQYTDPSALSVHLMVALPKGKTFPILLHKAVELGVREITPLLTLNTEVDGDRLDNKRDRWDAILVEALKQSGNPRLPRLNKLTPLGEALQAGGDPVRLCAALQPGARPLWRLLGEPLRPRGEIQVFVGPEGDFAQEEYAFLRDAGCHFTSLGPLVLKVETAASLVAGTLHLWALAASD